MRENTNIDYLPITIHWNIIKKIDDYYTNKQINDSLITIGLYCFYYYTARRQNNIRVKAKDTFVRHNHRIGHDKLKKIKRALKEMGLIEIVRPREKNGQYSKESYIEIKMVWKPETINKLFYPKEDTATTKYKIARELLLKNFNEGVEIESSCTYNFEPEFLSYDDYFSTNSFFFEDNLLKCKCYIIDEKEFKYTVPSDRLAEIVIDLANNNEYSFQDINYVLQIKDKPNV